MGQFRSKISSEHRNILTVGGISIRAHGLKRFPIIACHHKPIFIKMRQRIVMHEGIQIHPIGKACRIGRQPPSECRHVVPSTVIDKTCACIASFRRKSPGAENRSIEPLLAKRAVAVNCCLSIIERDEGGDIPRKIVDRSIGFALQFNGNGRAYFRVRC